MAGWGRVVAPLGMALSILAGSVGVASACETVQGQLPDAVPRFTLVVVGRIVSSETEPGTDYPAAYMIQVEQVIAGSLEPGIHRFTISDGCRAIRPEPGALVAWALTKPMDLTEWNAAAWWLEPDGATTLLTPWREWYPFPERMSRSQLLQSLREGGRQPDTAANSPSSPVAPVTDPTVLLLVGAAVGGALSLVRTRSVGSHRRGRGRGTLCP